MMQDLTPLQFLSDFAIEFISGGTPSTKDPEMWDGNIPWTTSAIISENQYLLNEYQKCITQKGLERSATHIVPKDNLVVGTRVGVGKAVKNLIDVCISQDLTGVVLDKERVIPEFLALQFKTDRIKRYFDGRKRGTTIKGVSRMDLEQVEVYVPENIQKQKVIAQILQAVQQAKDTRQKELTLEREHKAALMDHLFTHGTQNEPRKQTEIGEMPESWRTITIDNIADVKGGKRLPKGEKLIDQDTGFPYIVAGQLKNGTVMPEKQQYLPTSIASSLRNYTVNAGDVYITIVGAYIGDVGVIPTEYEGANLTENAAKILIRDKNHFDNEFLAYYLSGSEAQSQIKSLTVQTSQPKLALARIKMIKVPCPKIDEQREIKTILKVSNSLIKSLEKEISFLEELFQTLLEELMTGRLSVSPLLEPTKELVSV